MRIWTIFSLIFCGPLSFADVEYGGSGCPAQSAEASFDQDGNLTLKLSEYELWNEPGKGRLSCAVAWSISPPPGHALMLNEVKVNGYVDLKSGSTALFEGESFFSGGHGAPFKAETRNPGAQEITYVIPPSFERLPCGASGILRVNTSIKVNEGTSHFKIDSITIAKARLSRCT